MVAGIRLDEYGNTQVFMDEIQHFPQFLTMLNILYLPVCYVMSMEHKMPEKEDLVLLSPE